MLRGGSGRHVRVIQSASSGAITLQLTDGGGNNFVAASAVPRIALARIR